MLRNLRPRASSAITGFFPSFYRPLLLQHQTVAHHAIDKTVATRLNAAEPATSAVLGDFGPLP